MIPVTSVPLSRGFTLTELAVVLVIVALLIGGLLVPLGAQDEIRRTAETRKTLADAAEALLGFAASNGRLPCPTILATHGQESFASGGDASNGNCSNFYDGYLPASSLGLSGSNQDGLAVDAWGQPIRYAVYTGSIGGMSNPFTRTDGMRNATLASLASTDHTISVCASATGTNNSSCNSAIELVRKAPAILFSVGNGGGGGAAGPDESANLDGNPVFVTHEPTASGDFRHIVTWLSPNILYSKMISAGRLP